MRLFKDRRAAALELSRHLSFLKHEKPIVLGLVYGGVPMAEIIAHTLETTLDVLLIARLRAPKNPDHIVGAVDEHGRISMIRSTVRWHHLTSQQMVEPAREIFRELQRLRGQIRSVLPEFDVQGRTVIVVGQGVASGAKMLGAIASVRDRARKVVVAAPAGSGEAAWQLHDAADVVVIPHRPAKFKTVTEFYEDNSPVTDEMLLAIVENWVKRRPQQQPGVQTILMKLHNDLGQLLCCEIDLPPGTKRGSGPYPAVVFAHGYESDGRSPRTIAISRRLAKRGIIAVRAEFSGHGRSEGELANATPERMAADLGQVLHAVGMLDEVDNDRVGLVGSGSGAMLALEHAAGQGNSFRAIVVRGPMSGGEIEAALPIRAPTLIIHAELDHGLQPGLAPPLPSCHELLQIPLSTRLFGDVISFEMMVGATVDWLFDHLVPAPVAESAGQESDAGATATTPPSVAGPAATPPADSGGG